MKNYSSLLIIYNPNALKGKIDEHLPQIKQRLVLRYSVVDSMPTPKSGAEDLAYKYANKYDIIVSCGGDGTLHQVVNGVMKSGASPLIGILPFGSCNDVARSLKIPFDETKAVDCLLRLNTTNYDIMFDGTEYLTYSLATGYLTQVGFSTPKKFKRKLGRFSYFLAGLTYIFKYPTLPLTITCDGERIHGKFSYMMLINGEFAGGFNLNKGEDLSNGKVKLVLIKHEHGLMGWFSFIKMLLSGIKSVVKKKNVIVKDVTTVEIENHSNSTFSLDGEKSNFLKKKLSVNSTIRLIKK